MGGERVGDAYHLLFPVRRQWVDADLAGSDLVVEGRDMALVKVLLAEKHFGAVAAGVVYGSWYCWNAEILVILHSEFFNINKR